MEITHDDKEQQRHDEIVREMKIDNYIDVVLVLISLTTLILVAKKEFNS
jgi:hypothetical protein